MRNQITVLGSLAAFALSAACGGAAVEELGAPNTPASTQTPQPLRCTDPLCLDEDARAQLNAAQEAFAACTVAEEDNFENDPSGLRILDLRLDDDGELVVVLANVAPHVVGTYPSTALRVVDGPVEAGGAPHTEMDAATVQLYAIFACQSYETKYPITWTAAGRADLTAIAQNALGKESIHTVALSLVRAEN